MLALTGRTHAVAPESPPPETTDVPGNHPIAAPGAGADMVVLDTAPHAAEAALEAARASDFVLIPCRPATADLAAIGASIDLIRIADTPRRRDHQRGRRWPIHSRARPSPPLPAMACEPAPRRRRILAPFLAVRCGRRSVLGETYETLPTRARGSSAK